MDDDELLVLILPSFLLLEYAQEQGRNNTGIVQKYMSITCSFSVHFYNFGHDLFQMVYISAARHSFVADEDLHGRNVLLLTSFPLRELLRCPRENLQRVSGVTVANNDCMPCKSSSLFTVLLMEQPRRQIFVAPFFDIPAHTMTLKGCFAQGFGFDAEPTF